LSQWLRLEHLFVSLEDVVQQLLAFVDSNPTEVAILILKADDADCSDWPAMPGDCWQQVHERMIAPHLHRILPYDQRNQPIGVIAAKGCNICIVCQKLHEKYGDPYWPSSVVKGSWSMTYVFLSNPRCLCVASSPTS
jgi:hypothetical protein